MRTRQTVVGTLTLAILLAGAYFRGSNLLQAQAQPSSEMSFFITSVGSGNGANFGGLIGADRHCATLAAQAGGPDRRWRAYLSTQSRPQQPAVHARNRIGPGPWYNAKGVMIAQDVDDLHSDKNKLTKETQLTEKGTSPTMHDILTGSGLDGRAVDGSADTTCNNWTSSASDGSALLGHYDRQGGGNNPTSWNSAHASKGCSQANLQSTGGNGSFYCFGMN